MVYLVRLLFLTLGLAVASGSTATAQTVPAGACLLEDGRWCWPIPPTEYGQECTCQTPEGPFTGLTQ